MGFYMYQDREYFYTANIHRASCSQCDFRGPQTTPGTTKPPRGNFLGPYGDREEAIYVATQLGVEAINFCQACTP